MAGTHDFRIPQDMNDWMREVEKRLQRQERRLGSAASAVVTGTGNPTRIYDPQDERIPTEPPTQVVTINVTPDKKGMTVVVNDQTDQVNMFEYWLDDTLIQTTRSGVLSWSLDSLGQPMQEGVDYEWYVRVVNAAGAGPESERVVAQLNPEVDDVFVRQVVQAGFVLAGAITVGNITITPGDTENPGGITIPLSNGGLIKFPADGSDAVITAVLRARSLVSEQNLRILGTNNVVMGDIELAAGVTAPTTPPTVTTSWNGPGALTEFDVFRDPTSLSVEDSTTWMMGEYKFSGGLGTYAGFATTINKTTGLMGYTKSLGAGLSPRGIATIGTDHYVLVQRLSDATYWVNRYSGSGWTYQSQWQFNYGDTGGTVPVMATDGTSLFIARTADPSAGGSDPRLIVRKFSTAGVLDNAATTVTSIAGNKKVLNAIVVTAADFGGTRYVVTHSTAAWVVNTSGVRQVSEEFKNPYSSDLKGIAWDNGRFHAVSVGGIYHHSTKIGTSTHNVGYTWYDNDAAGVEGTQETNIGPLATFTHEARTWMRVDTEPPADLGGTDDANSVRIYVNNALQTSGTTGQTTYYYETPATGTGAPPGSNEFGPSTAPGLLFSGAESSPGQPLVSIDGSGKTRLGPLTTEPDGSGALGSMLVGTDGVSNLTQPTAHLASSSSLNMSSGVVYQMGVPTVVESEFVNTSTSSRVTITHEGFYLIQGHITWASGSTGTREARLVLNGATNIALQKLVANGVMYSNVNTMIRLLVNDYVYLDGVHTQGAVLAATSASLRAVRVSS